MSDAIDPVPADPIEDHIAQEYKFGFGLGYVYMLFVGDTVKYIGKTINIITRVNSHIKIKPLFDRVRYFILPKHLMNSTEKALIKRIKDETKDLPYVPLTLPMLVSLQPIFSQLN